MMIKISSYVKGLKSLNAWYKDKNKKIFFLIGCNGSGKTTILNKFFENINHIYYDCYVKISKKEFILKLKEQTNTNCVMHFFNETNIEQAIIFDEFDDFRYINNVNYSDIFKIIEQRNCKCVFSILKEENLPNTSVMSVKDYDIYKINQCSEIEIRKILKTKILKTKMLKVKFSEVLTKLKGNYSDIRQVINSVELNIYNSKHCNNEIDNLRQCQSNENATCIDVYNLLLSFHECYPNFTFKNTHVKFLTNMIHADTYYTYMFDKQLWDMNKYGMYCIYNNVLNLNLDNIKLSIGGMWSKISNAQYKKKLYNNFVYNTSNILFQYDLFLYNLKYTILDYAKKEQYMDIKNLLGYLHMKVSDFEQLVKITDFDNKKSSYNGKLKKTVLTSIKELKVNLVN